MFSVIQLSDITGFEKFPGAPLTTSSNKLIYSTVDPTTLTSVSTGDIWIRIAVAKSAYRNASGEWVEMEAGMDWRFVKEKPSTLAGLGITDAARQSGTAVTGNITLSAAPTSGTHLATKSYADGIIPTQTGNSGKKLKTDGSGLIWETLSESSYGGEVSGLNDYSEYYQADIYTPKKILGAGRPWEQQYYFNETSPTISGTWTQEAWFPQAFRYACSAMTKNRVYVLGGQSSDSTAYNTVYTAPINEDGTLGSWSTSTPLPVATVFAATVVFNNHLYFIGGEGKTKVYRAVINADGTLGSWIDTGNLPSSTSHAQAFATDTYIYTVSGYGAGRLIYRAAVNSDGTLSSWQSVGTVPSINYAHSIAVTENYLYVFGGYSNTYTSSVYRGTIAADGTIGNWVSMTSLPVTLGYAGAVVLKNKIFLIGGYPDADAIHSTTINTDGTLGTWSTTNMTTPGLWGGVTVATSSRIYKIGGDGGTERVYSTPFTGGKNDYSEYYVSSLCQFCGTRPGSGKSHEQQYEFNTSALSRLGQWSYSDVTYPIPNIMHSPVVVTKNRVYLLGGYTGSNDFSTIYTAVINTDGTLGSWTTSGTLSLVSNGQVITTKNRVFRIGGSTNSGAANEVRTAVINEDGTLGTFTYAGVLPSGIRYSQAIVTKNRVYLLGGNTSSTDVTSNIYTAPINTDGTLGTWTHSGYLNSGVQHASAVVTKNRVYLLGGQSTAQIRYTTINSDGTIGSSWANAGNLPAVLSQSHTIVTKNRVYLVGGVVSGTEVNTVYTAAIDSNGVIGTWSLYGTLPEAVGYKRPMFVTKNRVYLFGNNSKILTATLGDTDYSMTDGFKYIDNQYYSLSRIYSDSVYGQLTAAGSKVFMPFYAKADYKFNRLGLYAWTSTGTCTLRLGVYTAVHGKAKDLITYGDVTVTTTKGVYEATIDFQAEAGKIYYLVVRNESGQTCTFRTTGVSLDYADYQVGNFDAPATKGIPVRMPNDSTWTNYPSGMSIQASYQDLGGPNFLLRKAV